MENGTSTLRGRTDRSFEPWNCPWRAEPSTLSKSGLNTLYLRSPSHQSQMQATHKLLLFFSAVNPLYIALCFGLAFSRNSLRNWPNFLRFRAKSERKENVRFSSRRRPINRENCCLLMERCVSTAHASILRYPVSRYCVTKSSSDVATFLFYDSYFSRAQINTFNEHNGARSRLRLEQSGVLYRSCLLGSANLDYSFSTGIIVTVIPLMIIFLRIQFLFLRYFIQLQGRHFTSAAAEDSNVRRSVIFITVTLQF